MELVHECCPKRSRMGTSIMKSDEEQDKDKEERREYGKKQSGNEKNKSRWPITTQSKFNNNGHNRVLFYTFYAIIRHYFIPPVIRSENEKITRTEPILKAKFCIFFFYDGYHRKILETGVGGIPFFSYCFIFSSM